MLELMPNQAGNSVASSKAKPHQYQNVTDKITWKMCMEDRILK